MKDTEGTHSHDVSGWPGSWKVQKKGWSKMINDLNWKAVLFSVVTLALLSIVACGTSEPPPDATVNELARLKAAGVKSASEELERMQSAGVVSADVASKDGVPANSTINELARLKAAGVKSASEELERMQSSGVVSVNATTKDGVPAATTIDEMARLKAAGSADAEKQLAIWDATTADADHEIAAVVVLARYSTPDDREAERRVDAAREIVGRVERGELSNEEAVTLLHTIAPEFSISQRKRAADRLTSISDSNDGELSPSQRMQVANELTRLVTGHGIDAGQRVGAARQVVALSESGELNADNGSELMEAIAPELSVSQRKEAFQYLNWQFRRGGDWGPERTKRTAEEGYRLITGGEMRVEERASAGVELTGEALKRYGGDTYDNESVDRATDLIKETMFGDLTTDKTSSIMGWDD